MIQFAKNYRYAQWAMSSLCFLGFILSYYSYHVETSKEKNEDYKAMCDISEHVSCSNVFTSRFGKGFGVLHVFTGEDSILYQPNCVYGMLFYLTLGIIGQFSNIHLMWVENFMILSSCFISLYLGYILYFILHNFCLVCITSYIINGMLLMCNLYKLNSVFGLFRKKVA